jgi:hypothetical protein
VVAKKAIAERGSDDGTRRAEAQQLSNGTWKAGVNGKFLTSRNLRKRGRAWVTLYTPNRARCTKWRAAYKASLERPSIDPPQLKLRLRQIKVN